MIYKYSLLLIMILFGYSCSKYPNNVRETLDSSGSNRAELEKVLDYYRNKGDSLKLEAAYFLIGNMDMKFTYNYSFMDIHDNPIYLNFNQFKNNDEVQKGIDSIFYLPVFKSVNSKIEFDCEILTAKYIIKNIEDSFVLWDSVKWCKNLSFNEFCEYILPYRVLTEPLSDWRESLNIEFKYINDKFLHDTVSKACTYLNSGLNDTILFWSAYNMSRNLQSIDSILVNKKGKCPDLTILSASAMRSIGIPVMVDVCYYWGDTGYGHFWNRLVTADGSTIRYNPIDKYQPPGKHPNEAKMPKVFRLTYQKQKDCLFNLVNNKTDIPGVFIKDNIMDVTEEYTETGDVFIELKGQVPDECEFAYICVYNYDKWKPVYWGRIKDNKVIFKNMGKNILYMPMFYSENTLTEAGYPFIYSESGKIINLKPNYNKDTIEIYTYMTKIDGKRKTIAVSDNNFNIKYWDNIWKTIPDYKYDYSKIISSELPKNCLYMIEPENPNINATRPFIIDNGQQIFY